jgi:hypothetical protein
VINGNTKKMGCCAYFKSFKTLNKEAIKVQYKLLTILERKSDNISFRIQRVQNTPVTIEREQVYQEQIIEILTKDLFKILHCMKIVRENISALENIEIVSKIGSMTNDTNYVSEKYLSKIHDEITRGFAKAGDSYETIMFNEDNEDESLRLLDSRAVRLANALPIVNENFNTNKQSIAV